MMHACTRSPALFRRVALLGAALFCGSAFADDCDTIKNAMKATLQAPAMRQYMAVAGRPERLISVTKGDTVYMTLIPGQASKTPRAEVAAEAAEAEKHKKLSNCKAQGSEDVAGTSTRIYSYEWSIDGGSSKGAKVWIGSDGLLRKQGTDHSAVRYDYANVQAPN